MGLGILWSAENWPRKEQPWRVASGTRAVSREGPKKSWRQKVWRASRKNCNFTHSPPHTLELNHCRLVSGFCQYLSVCVSVGLRYSSGSGDTPEEAKKRPRLKAHKGKCRLGVITGSLFYKFCLLLEAPWDLFQSRCLSTWFGLSSMLFHYIWGIFFFFFIFPWKGKSNTEDIHWVFSSAYPWDFWFRQDSRNHRHHHKHTELHNFQSTFALITSLANISIHWKSPAMNYLMMC